MNLGSISEDNLKDALLRIGYVREEDIKEVEKDMKENSVGLVYSLLNREVINQNLIGEAIAEIYKVPYADLDLRPAKKDLVTIIPEEFAKRFRVIVKDIKGETIEVATENPSEKSLLPELKKLFFDIFLKRQQLESLEKYIGSLSVSIPQNPKIAVFYALPDNIDKAFIYYREELGVGLAEVIKSGERVASIIMNKIIEDALLKRASDIHLEPKEKNVRLRFRIDGKLHEAGGLPLEYYDQLINAIKLAANLRIDEHSAIQDGAIRWVGGEEKKQKVDLRVSIAPTVFGETVTMRILAKYLSQFSLDEIGFESRNKEIVSKEIKKPFGMVLVVGPTGSGKTTTLYALIQILNKPDAKIVTIEDPVEYRVEDIHQIQVNILTGITFPKALKSIVRQDPDIVLVGEIRDEETASLGTNVALTGHLLLSTFHANDAASGITRLMQMGVEPFLISSTLEVVISQRLVRKICSTCRFSNRISTAELIEKYPSIKPHLSDKEKTVTIYEGKGCDACNNSGYLGRTAVFEIIQVTPEIKDLILHHPSSAEIWSLARKQGAESLFEDGLAKAMKGVTTIQELFRIARPPVE